MAASTASSGRPEQNRLLGICLRVGAATAFAFMASMIKLAYSHGVSTPELGFYRFAFSLPPLFIWIAWSGNFTAWKTARPMAHVGRAAIGLVCMILGFSALAFLPLAEATIIGFAAPLFSVMLSALILKERVGKHRWSAVMLGLLGVLVVMRPAGTHLPTFALMLALAGAFGVGLVTITVRQIGRTESTQTTVLWSTLLSMLAFGLTLPFYARAHDPATWTILAALGLFGGIAQLLLTASLRFAPVPVVVPFDYIQLLWAVLLGWWVFGTHPSANTWAGAAVIIASGLYTVYREHRLGRDKPRETPPL
jgi:drug/metabolite transporter (DMT)-like permease